MTGLRCLTCLALALAVTASARATPPKVIKAIPDNGAIDVNPALAEIRVTFDQDMNRGGFSWVGGGENFPGAGKARWVDARTCALPIKLKPNHDYTLSVNN